MASGWVYVVHNDGIQSPKAKDGCKTYKIGITKKTVSKRYYGLGLKMPGEFFCKFAYRFDNGRYGEVEGMLKNLLNQLNDGGEWFNLNTNALKGVQSVCEACDGVLDTDTIQKQITEKDSIPPKYTPAQWANMTQGQKAAAKAHATQEIIKQQKHEKRSQAGMKAAATRKKNAQKNN